VPFERTQNKENVSLFAPLQIRTHTIGNRFVFAAATSGTAADEYGVITEEECKRLVHYAENGVGLIITGAVSIHPYGQFKPASCQLYNDDSIASFSRLTAAVSNAGGSTAAQLSHSGLWSAAYQKTLGNEAVGPSIVPLCPYTEKPFYSDNYHAATDDDLVTLVDSFGDAAERVTRAGFDAVEVHAAHDSVFSQFLSPLTNLRKDRYGGALKNRIRLHCEVLNAIRDRVGPEYPIIVKLGVQDGMLGGLTFDEGQAAAQSLAKAGCDVLEISQGLQGAAWNETALRSPISRIDEEGFTRAWCSEVKQATGIPTIMTGGLRSLELIELVVANEETDFVGLCRPLIREPELVLRWQQGDRRKATCISCNNCVLATEQGAPLKCYVDNDIV
jgi:2,4-dienoyl-CoA reductase-like NADH-dependent reductase (Old Yellow Enzyme family)